MDIKTYQIILFFILSNLSAQSIDYPWLENNHPQINYRVKDIHIIEGYKRQEYQSGTFQHWLRQLPLKKNVNQVNLYNGLPKANQNAHFGIIDIDIGDKNLQQCADAVIRLYSEYLYSQNRYGKIAFNFTSGDRAEYRSWIKGYRPFIKVNKVKWKKQEEPDHSYRGFRNYLNTIFIYAGSYSLSKELKPVADINKIETGDIFIQGGFPGHAVIVVDMAVNTETQKKIIMLAQSYMPAQDIYILKNPNDEKLSPWYELKATEELYTPEWTFHWTDLKQFSQ
jgi:hypothetical protein